MERIEVRPRHVARLLIAALVMFVAIATIATGGLGAEIFGGVVALATITFVLLRSRRMIVLDGTGVTLHGVTRKHINWDHVAYYSYWTTKGLGDAAAQKPDPERWFAAIKIVGVDGTQITIDHKWQRPYRAVEAAIEQIHPRLQTNDFDPFSLSEGALRHRKRGGIVFGEIDRVVVTADQLSVRERGKTLEWAGSNLRRLDNALLFLERLAEQGVNVIVTGGQLIPPPVTERMRAARAKERA